MMAEVNCQSGLQGAGKTMAAVDNVNAMWDTVIEPAADANNIDPSLLAAIAVRESGGNNVWQGCTTEASCANANGAGIFQIDLKECGDRRD
jgi:hypothetical protein